VERNARVLVPGKRRRASSGSANHLGIKREGLTMALMGTRADLAKLANEALDLAADLAQMLYDRSGSNLIGDVAELRKRYDALTAREPEHCGACGQPVELVNGRIGPHMVNRTDLSQLPGMPCRNIGTHYYIRSGCQCGRVLDECRCGDGIDDEED